MQNSNCRALKMSSCEFRYLWGWASWKQEWWVPTNHCNSEVPKKAEPFSSNRSDLRQIVVTAVPLSIRPPVTQPFVFSCLHISPHLFPGLGASLLQTSQHISPWWLFSHVLIHLPGIDLKFRDVTLEKHLSYFKRHCYFFWVILACQTNRPSRNAPNYYPFASAVFSAPAWAS